MKQDFTQIKPHAPKAFINKNTSLCRQATRDFLMKKSPHCAYCGVNVIYFKNQGGILPDNFATLDHYFSKNSGGYFDEQNFVVLCCYRCNQEKNYEEK